MMTRTLVVLTIVAGLFPAGSISAHASQMEPTTPGWPRAQSAEKPWTRWWWPGNAVDKANLTQHLEKFAEANLGGVEITPIYGAMGHEGRYIDFLSPRFMEMLEYAGREARRLGLGVDISTGTGWPFGGPWVDKADAVTRLTFEGGQLTPEPTGMTVKRAGPGGEGLVLDPYSPEALRRYLAPFDKAFANLPTGLIRGQFHDDFQYYEAGWTAKFPEVFREMHGYDLQKYAAELMGRKAMDLPMLGRIKSDYRETLAKLHMDFVRTWVEWANAHGFVARNEAHGAPVNLLDLYAIADIPETETFGATEFPIAGLRREPDEVRDDLDLPEPLVTRMASSAAHVAGRQLIAGQTATWLRDNWKVALAFVKPELDRVMLDGVNHILYHGTVFSPQDVPWPGWLFYAATQFNPNNTWWDDFGALNRYVERVQSVLQGGEPDNDILLYWPIYDLWDDPTGLMQPLSISSVGFIMNTPTGAIARRLDGEGYSFDYISDAQLLATRAGGGELLTPGSRYQVLVVPPADRMPVETLRQILGLVEEGATVVMTDLPKDVPGYGRLEKRQAEFQRLLQQLVFAPTEVEGVEQGVLGTGRVLRGEPLAALDLLGVPREPITETGVGYIRRRTAAGHDYFFANLTSGELDGWVKLSVPVHAATILDPVSGRGGVASVRSGAAGQAQIYLQLASGESVVVRTLATNQAQGRKWAYLKEDGAPVALEGTWKIEFVKGGPELPAAITTKELKSWTDMGGDATKRFGGTARYSIEFEMPRQKADAWVLDLGDVRESARVRLNGRDVATAWCLPFKVQVGDYLQPGRNVLELEVTNLAANRIRDMDQRGVKWKIMREINFVDVRYEPFDASNWLLKSSGLLGPVRLHPMRVVSPEG